ncbi:hypothetical protein M5C72_01005 [Companilactobacillus allii]|uniref:Uncharacterized protein n=1 Tax=Companilactobacillus allii TaxID=1847728 RepID=A0A1P8Q1M4_9LACO|nr:hypothetical protein [Companilactobacillus allii]APX71758.1 hypothetical protein BTM29_03940 [Companilactobacillus allii]USQ68845.1 hypothetical protein M5C72_01005 [Companilactobacillus allii]
MNDLLHNYRMSRTMGIVVLLGLFMFGTLPIMIIAYCYLALVLIIHTWVKIGFSKKVKSSLTVIYGFMLAFQITFVTLTVFPMHNINLLYYPAKIFAVVLFSIPFLVERFITVSNGAEFYMPTVESVTAISFEELRDNTKRIRSMMQSVSNMNQKISIDHVKTVLEDIPRHSSVRYINQGTLTQYYFDAAKKSLDDEHMYLVVSNTGSPASEIISAFTQKQFNHVSLSFDRALDTIISYNGGDNIYPPGMNAETLEFFHQKSDASVLIYSLPATVEQKQFLIDKIAEINHNGSAYNLLGLVAKHSYKPNIMFCSQFVYKMLKLAGLEFFDKKDGEVRPTDFIELDYYKKLDFEYEITF